MPKSHLRQTPLPTLQIFLSMLRLIKIIYYLACKYTGTRHAPYNVIVTSQISPDPKNASNTDHFGVQPTLIALIFGGAVNLR